jgi:hypothetical protein
MTETVFVKVGKMKKNIAIVLLALGMFVTTASASVISYDYSSTLGADPTAQGWTYSRTSNITWVGGYNTTLWSSWTGPAGWRVVDASTSSGSSAFYSMGLTTAQMGEMALGWTIDWTFSMDSSAWGTDGTSTSAGYYLPPANYTRQNGIWVETTGYKYTLYLSNDASGNLVVRDGTVDHILTSGGNNNAFDTQYTVSISYNGTDAVLSFGGNDFTLTKQAASANTRIVFGATGSSGRGSAIYDNITMTIPEPATVVILALGSLVLRRRIA